MWLALLIALWNKKPKKCLFKEKIHRKSQKSKPNIFKNEYQPVWTKSRSYV